jgi:hypothetical protein
MAKHRSLQVRGWRGIALGLVVVVSGLVLRGGPAEAANCATCPMGYMASGPDDCINPHAPPGMQTIACPGSGGFGKQISNSRYIRSTTTTVPAMGGPVTQTEIGYDLDQYIRDHPEQFQKEEGGENGTAHFGKHLGMYISAPSDPSAGGFGGGAVIHTDAVGITDSTGALPAGTTAPTSHSVAGFGGIGGAFDASRFVGLTGNQNLTVRGEFDYGRFDTTYGASPALAATGLGNSATMKNDVYTLTGSFAYTNGGGGYLQGNGSIDLGRGTFTDNTTAGQGNFDSTGYSTEVRIGNVWTLIDTTRSSHPAAVLTKAPPPASGGYALGIDLSGSLGYTYWRGDGFTESSGFAFGAEQVQFGDVGGRARLFVVVPNSGWIWMPYIAGTVDQLFGYSHTLAIPTQATVAGDTIFFNDAKTFGGAEVGVDMRAHGGWDFGLKGFYEASADTTITGGRAYVKVPFNYTPRPAFASRY